MESEYFQIVASEINLHAFVKSPTFYVSLTVPP